MPIALFILLCFALMCSSRIGRLLVRGVTLQVIGLSLMALMQTTDGVVQVVKKYPSSASLWALQAVLLCLRPFSFLLRTGIHMEVRVPGSVFLLTLLFCSLPLLTG